jgi:hypothetical protein
VLRYVSSALGRHASLAVRRTIPDGIVIVLSEHDTRGWQLHRDVHEAFPSSHWEVVVAIDTAR